MIGNDKKGDFMQFYLPEEFTKSNIPLPEDNSIEVTSVDAGHYAVLRFSGRPNKQNFDKHAKILKNHCEEQNRDYSEIKKTLHTNVVIGENEKDLNDKLNKISEVTGIPKEMYIDKPLIGTVDKVFNTIDEFKSVECAYIIAYVPDIVWGNSLEILSEKI